MRTRDFNKAEIVILKKLLTKLRPVPQIPAELFILLMSKNVPVTTELALINDKKVLLTYRSDSYYKGWHFPGRYMAPGETFKEACSNTASQEAGLRVKKVKLIATLNLKKNKRFHCISLFFLCHASGKAKEGSWFAACPRNIIPEHKELWSIFAPHLKK